jgi:hypothetical protein
VRLKGCRGSSVSARVLLLWVPRNNNDKVHIGQGCERWDEIPLTQGVFGKLKVVVLAAGGIVEGARIRQSAFGSEGKA